MTDATAQAAFKKAIAIDAAADQLMDASDQLAAELGQAAPGTAPMIEAQSAVDACGGPRAYTVTWRSCSGFGHRYGEYRSGAEIQRESCK